MSVCGSVISALHCVSRCSAMAVSRRIPAWKSRTKADKRSTKQRTFYDKARQNTDLDLAIDEARKAMLNARTEGAVIDEKSIASTEMEHRVEDEVIVALLSPQCSQRMNDAARCSAERGNVKLSEHSRYAPRKKEHALGSQVTQAPPLASKKNCNY